MFGTTSRDEPVFFPPEERTYCGIISMPTSGSISATGVVLLAGTGPGTGMIGRNRMWVRMARTLADMGTPVLRFDYAGVGDSKGEMVGYDLDTPAVDALQAAFDVLGARGVEEVIVVGTCYGARTALAGSAGDPRVVGLHLLVPPVGSGVKGADGINHAVEYTGWTGVARKAIAPRTIRRLVRSESARRAATRFIAVRLRRVGGQRSVPATPGTDSTAETATAFEMSLNRLLADGVYIQILFGMDDFFWTEFKEAVKGRLGKILDEFSEHVTVKTVPGVLRGFPTIRAQDAAVESVVDAVGQPSSVRRHEQGTESSPHSRNNGHGDPTEEVAYFGPEPRMYGVTYLPHGIPRASVVICSSIHAELLKSYRTEVLLARALARQGFAVHRFHYPGTGNSEAAEHELTLPEMIEASRMATDRIVSLAGTDRLVFVGVRLGAYPATVLSAEYPGGSLILWDPVLDTNRFMKEALRSHAIAGIRGELRPETLEESLARLDREGSIELLGYEMRSEFHASIRGKKLTDYSPGASNVLVVPFGKTAKEPLTQTWGISGTDVTSVAAPDRAAWWLVEEVSRERNQRAEALAPSTADWISSATP